MESLESTTRISGGEGQKHLQARTSGEGSSESYGLGAHERVWVPLFAMQGKICWFCKTLLRASVSGFLVRFKFSLLPLFSFSLLKKEEEEEEEEEDRTHHHLLGTPPSATARVNTSSSSPSSTSANTTSPLGFLPRFYEAILQQRNPIHPSIYTLFDHGRL